MKTSWTRLIVFIVVFGAVPHQPSAQGTSAVYGPAGTRSCATWTSVKTAAEAAMLAPPDVGGTLRISSAATQESWILGFISGAAFEQATMRQTDGAAILQSVTNYCVQHPNDHVSQAASALAKTLRPGQ